MVDTVEPQTTIATPVTVSDAPAAASIDSSAPVTSSTEAAAHPPVAAVPVADAPKTEMKTDAAKTDAPIPPVENILGDTKPEIKPEEKKIDAAAKPESDKPADKEAAKDDKATTETKTEEKPSEKPALPVYDEYKFPENFTPDKEAVSELTKIIGEVEIGKLDHKGYQEFGQKLIDLATKNTQVSIDRYTESLIQQHNKTGDEWLSAFKKDPELAGGNIGETISTLQDAVGRFGGNEAQVKEFRDLMVNTNVGKHPALIRVIKNMNDKIKAYESEPKSGMVPAGKPAPQAVKPYQMFYSGSGGR
jgi:hypothetical protein